MLIFTRHIGAGIIKSFLLGTAVMLVIALLTRLVHFSELITSGGAKLWDVLAIMGLIQPKLLSILMPFTLFVACILEYNKIISNNEHISIYNTGSGNFALLKPFFLVSFLLLLASLAISLFVIPPSYNKIAEIQQRIMLDYSSSFIKPKELTEERGFIVFMHEPGKGIFLADWRVLGQKLVAITDEGLLGFNGQALVLEAKKTYILKEFVGNKFPLISTFDEYTISAKIGNSNPIEARRRHLLEDNMELLRSALDGSLDALRELQSRIGWPFFTILIPFAIIACLLRFFSHSRSRIDAGNIAFSFVIVGYTMLSGLLFGNFIKSLLMASFYFANICLIFIFLFLLCRK